MEPKSAQALAEHMTYHGSDRRGRPLPKVPDYLVALSRQLRDQGTTPEAVLWGCLRDRQLAGAKFRRQHAIGRYVVDFYSHEHRLVVELDGQVHGGARQSEYDLLRDRELRSEGFRVIRIRNELVTRSPVAALRLILAGLRGS